MAELQICLLGSFQVCWDFAPVPPNAWRSPWGPRLLGLLLVKRPDPLTAEEAVRLLGGGMMPADLAPTVEHIRRVLKSAATVVMAEGKLEFRPGPACWIDLDAMGAHYEAGVRSASRGEMLPAILAFQEADALYQGDLLEEIQEPWVQEPRRLMRERYTEILERLAEGHAVLARYQDAVGFCHKALAHDPLRESTYQRMMVYYYYLGDRAGAEESYAACREALEGSGRQVSPETHSLLEQLTSGQPGISPASQVAAAAQEKE